MKLRIKLFILATAFILTGCVHPQSPSTSSPAPTSTPPASTEQTTGPSVTYTDSGFTPKQLTVSVNSTVTFINQSSHQMWVASSIHPTHQDLPGFDQLQGSGQGTSYSYTFTQPGTWQYHNHLLPGATGTIIVQ